jgi:hypothetical protein
VADKKSFSKILRSVCAAQGWELLPSGVNVIHPNGRHQVVSFELFDFNHHPVVRLVSMIGTTHSLSLEQVTQALRANMDLAHGALALNGNDLCMTDTLSLADADPGEVEAAVSFLAEMADYYEQIMFGTDDH